MKLTVNRPELVKELAYVCRVVPSNPTIPILGCVLVEAPTTGLTAIKLKTTNVDITLTSAVENVEVTAKGGICLWAKRLAKVLGEMNDAQVTLTADDKNAVTITGASCSFKLMGIAEEDFPVTQEVSAAPLTLSGQVLADAVAPVLHAVSTDETRFILNSVLVHADSAGEIHAVATDGRRLAVCGGAVAPDALSAVVPTAAARLMVTLAEAEKVTLGVGPNNLTMTGGVRGFVSKLIDGSYPNWRQVVPKDHIHTVELDVAANKAAIHRMAIVAEETIQLTFSAQTLTVSGAAVEVGSGAESLTISNGPKEPIKIAFAPRYVLEALTACGDTATVLLEDGESPMVVISDRFKAVIMPKRTT